MSRHTTLIDRYGARAKRAGWSLDTFDHIRAELDRLARQVKKLRHKGKVRTEYQSNRDARCAVISAYTLAIDDVLALIKEAKR